MIKEFPWTAIITKEKNISYTELIQRVNLFAQQTPQGGRKSPQENTKVVIFSENREGWIYAFFSVWQNKAIAVPMDASSTVSDVAYILKDCQPSAVWVSLSLVDTLRKAAEEAQVEVKILIIDDYEEVDAYQMSRESSFGDESDVALIIYTSGTTGSPKGVMLTYSNLYANMRGVSDEVPIFGEHVRSLILLPLHHVLPLMGTVIIPIIKGGGVAICPSMTGAAIMETLAHGEVNIFIGVPRLWQMLYSGIKKKIDEAMLTRGLFSLSKTLGSKKFSRFIFQSVHKKLGGHLTYCVSGGAALDKEIGQGLKTLGLDVLEGYGMTETAPIITFTRPDDILPGCVGLPLPSVQCKLVDGELCAKGPNLMSGYYNRPQETQEVIDRDGFIHTGDLAEIDAKGRVTITGRKKEIIVLSNGKNVQPNEIEYLIEKYDDKVKECAITEQNDMLLAIIVPQDVWAHGKTTEEIEEQLKKEVLAPYNTGVENYKKVMRLFVYFGELPRTRMDKIQRFKLKDLLKAEKKAEIKRDTTIPLSDEFIILQKYLEEEKHCTVTPESNIETDLGLDSLDRVSLQGFIEQSFGVNLNAADMIQFANLQQMTDFISRQKTKMEAEHTDWNSLLNGPNAEVQLPSTSLTLNLGKTLFKTSFKLYNSLTIKGKQNIPENGPFILAANHQSMLDGPLVVSGMSHSMIRNSYFYATEEHVQHPALRYLASHNNIILMEKQNLRNSILKLAEVLKQGKNVVIFPEGRRTHSGEIGEFRKMFAILAIELGIPVLPVVIRGAYKALPRTRSVALPAHIEVEYLPVVRPEQEVNGHSVPMSYDQLSEEIRNQIRTAL